MTANVVKRNPSLKHISVKVGATVADVLRMFATHKPGKTGLPAGIALVVDARGTLKGIVTHGDLNRALAARVPFETPIRDVMNPKPFVVVDPASNQEIVSTVTEKVRKEKLHKTRLEKIIVVDKQQRVVNVLSIFDVWQGSDIRVKQIGVVGLGYVGLTLGLTLADLGFEVRGFDLNPKVKQLIRKKQAPFFEVGLPELLREHGGKRFKIADSFKEDPCDVYFIAVGTPLSKTKKPDLGFLTSAAADIGRVLKAGDLVVLRSTVPLGTTRGPVIQALEKQSGLIAGEDFFVAFAPERTVEGKALEELRTLPQVIGGINRASANLASDIFNMMTHTIHIVDTLEEAEVVKLINNTYRDVTFAFANEVALICERWGIDTNKVINAANAGYPRSNVPRPSPGVGGYCLDKDPYIFMEGGLAKEYHPLLFKHARDVNNEILQSVARRIMKHVGKNKKAKIFILGYAFKGKPATSDLRGSPTIALTKTLQDAGYRNIWGFDPVVKAAELKPLGIRTVPTANAGFKGADAVIIMNNHEDLASPRLLIALKTVNSGAMFFDTWALHNKEEVAKHPEVIYYRL